MCAGYLIQKIDLLPITELFKI